MNIEKSPAPESPSNFPATAIQNDFAPKSPSDFPAPETQNDFAPESPSNFPESQKLPAELPTKSPNRVCDFYLREIAREGRMPDVRAFLESAINREPYRFAASENPAAEPANENPAENPNAEPSDLEKFSRIYSDIISAALSPAQKFALKNYSGYNYKSINQVSRGIWNYDLLGPQTPEKLEKAHRDIDELSAAISAAPPAATDLATYRGTNLDAFHSYGIHSLADLKSLENQFYLESGFTSTSLSPDRSFFNQLSDDPYDLPRDIAIEYLIPEGSHESVGLLSDETSYSPAQREVLINRDNLSYVSSVKIADDGKSAKLKMILIPRQICDPRAP